MPNVVYPVEWQLRISPATVGNFTKWVSPCLSMHESDFAEITTLLVPEARGSAFRKNANICNSVKQNKMHDKSCGEIVSMMLLALLAFSKAWTSSYQFAKVHWCICYLEGFMCLQWWKFILWVVVEALNDHQRFQQHFVCWPKFRILLHSRIQILQERP